MGQQPLVPSTQQQILPTLRHNDRFVRVGTLRQRHQNPEAFTRIRMAGGIMQRSRVAFHHHPGRHQERLDFGCIQHAINDFALLGKKQNKIFRTQIELAVPVIFQTIQLGIVAVAPSKLDRHTAIQTIRYLHHSRQFLQSGIFRHINGCIGQWCIFQNSKNLFDSVLHTLYNLSIVFEFGIINGIDFHTAPPYRSSANNCLQAG